MGKDLDGLAAEYRYRLLAHRHFLAALVAEFGNINGLAALAQTADAIESQEPEIAAIYRDELDQILAGAKKTRVMREVR